MLAPELRAAIDEETALLDEVRRRLVAAPLAPGVPDAQAPYAAHLRIEIDGLVRDVLFGSGRLADGRARVQVVPWRSSPLAAVFARCGAGDRFELPAYGRPVAGRVLTRRLLTFERGEIVRIDVPEAALVRNPARGWTLCAPDRLPRLAGRRRPVALARGRAVPLAARRLDATQRSVIERDAGASLVVSGTAGSGKTTLAILRLARLHRSAPGRFPVPDLLVIVPEPALAARVAELARPLGLGAVEVSTFEDWVARQALRVFPDLPERLSADAPAGAVALKRHPALRSFLPRFVARLANAAARRLDHAVVARGRLAERLQAQHGTLRERLDLLEPVVLDESRASFRAEVRAAFAEERRRLYGVRDDLAALFGDRAVLAEVVVEAAGGLGARTLAETDEHARVQLCATTERQLAETGVRRERATAVDGLGLDAGTPLADAGTVDVEDLAVAFELLRLKTGDVATSYGAPDRYAHIAIDEAQELAPIQLGLLGRVLRAGGTLTVCGDAAQQLDEDSHFAGWDRLLADMDIRADVIELRTSYRCPAPVVRFARAVLGPLAPCWHPRSARRGPAVLRSVHASEAHAVEQLGPALADLRRRAPRAAVAVLVARPDTARRLHALLPPPLGARLALAADPACAPGIEVTTVRQVKGLEYDVVVIPDGTAEDYPDTPAARRCLHVACTRALEQVWILSPGRPSPLLPA